MYLDFFFESAFETRPYDFTLTRLETISGRRNGANIIRHRETNELLVDKLRIWYFIEIMVEVSTRLNNTCP